MSYKNVDRDRLRYLLFFGVEPQHIQDFIHRNKKKLISYGVRLDNIPKDINKKISIIANLPDKGHKLFQDWLEVILNKYEILYSVDDLISEFHQKETDKSILPKDINLKYCRTALQYLVKPDCPNSLLDFLRTPLRAKRSQPDIAPPLNDQSDYVLDEVSSIIFEDIDLSPDFKIPNSAALVKAFIDLKCGMISEAEQWCQQIDPISPYRQKMADLISLERLKKEKRVSDGKGINCLSNIVVDFEDIDPEELDVFGFCFSIREDKFGNSVHFIDVIGFIQNRNLVIPDSAELVKLFPERGKIICFSKGARFRMPHQDEFGVWKVKLHDTEKDIKYKVHESVLGVYHVELVPHLSSEYDEVRRFIKNRKPYPNQRIFWLEDGVLLKPSGNVVDFERMNFDVPLDGWNSLDGICWQDQFFVLGELPQPDFKYDCSDLGGAIKKVLKSLNKIEGMPPFNNSQITELSRFLDSDEFQLLPRQIDRVKTELSSYSNVNFNILEVVDLLLVRPDIKKLIDEAKEKAVENALVEQVKLKQNVEALRLEKVRIEKSIGQKNIELRQFQTKLSVGIKNTFDDAVKNGEKVLIESAIFNAILNNKLSGMSKTNENFDNSVNIPFDYLDHKNISLEEIFTLSGLSKRHIRCLVILVPLLVRNGFSIVFKGRSSSLISELIARSLSKTKIAAFNVAVGEVNGLKFNNILHEDNKLDGILLRNSNLSPMESYFPDFITAAYKRLCKFEDQSLPSLYLTVTDNDFCFSLPNDLLWSCAVINLDIEHSFDANSEFDFFSSLDDFLEQRLRNKFWARAAKNIAESLDYTDGIDKHECLMCKKVLFNILTDHLVN